MTDPKESRIAIRFGASSSSKPNSSHSSRPTPSSALGKRHRPRFDHHDDDSSADDEPGETQVESITHFSANGAEFVQSSAKRHELSGRGSSPRRDRSTYTKKEENPVRPDRDVKGEQVEEEALKYGLTISKKAEPSDIRIKEENDNASQPIKTIDEEAIDALMSKDPGRHHRSEDSAYRDATANAPKEDDLETYDAIPVEGFGASLLMGQGWDGKMRGPKAKEITRRPNGMGLGSKKMSGQEDLGKWDSKSKSRSDKRPRLDEYRRSKDKERNRREDRHRDTYKNERERERNGDRSGDSGRDRERNHHSRSDRDQRR
ncbi:DExH-box splicing factor binding site-domain-containing protein [Coniella lustricola]|uniref:Pre-mRNA-splicing factor n=1 Tax=Coniella lustricola TaxID=2025994 RepID=A0A2T3AFQ8_9PEZI|nr:DExH-box splicing factor binding site-domain-containing protein [Coniella lustricola]